MKLRRSTSLGGLALLCASILGGPPAAYPEVIPEGWEQPAVLDAATLLGGPAIAGPHFTIEPRVENDGWMNRYVVVSSYQRIGATGDTLALERAGEQEAVAALREIKTTDAYATGIKAAVRAPLAVTREALTNPVGVLKSVPDAVSNLWSDVKSAVGGVRKGGERDSSASEMMKEVLGYHRVKARLASELGVDVYSSNAVLQTDLDDVSWSIFAGGASIDLAMTQAPLAASLSKSAVEVIDGAQAPLWAIPPATLREASSKALQTMDLAQGEADAIAWHPVCTLSQQTVLVSLLVELEGVAGRDAFARLAATAREEADCRLYVETAKLLWVYQQQQGPIESLRVEGGVLSMRDGQGRLVLPMRADYLFWTEQAQARVDSLPASGDRALWLSGTLSKRAREEFERRSIAVHEQVLKRHPADVDVAAVLAPQRAETADSAP